MPIKVALLGLGTMGSEMARNLLKAGFPLRVYNRTYEKAEALRSEGAVAARTPQEAASGADVVLSMLADDGASRATWLGERGALAAMNAGAVAVDCGTVSPGWIAEFHQAAQAKGIHAVDAPVTGSRPQAEAAQLTFLTGADTEILERIHPVLQSMSKEILHAGPVGSGVQLKLINNYLCGVQVASFAEALVWIERSGLDNAQAVNFLKRAAPGSPIVATMAERMAKRTYEVNFLLDLMRKDMTYAQQAALDFGVVLSTAENAEGLFAKAQREGYGTRDMAAVIEVVRRGNP